MLAVAAISLALVLLAASATDVLMLAVAAIGGRPLARSTP